MECRIAVAAGLLIFVLGGARPAWADVTVALAANLQYTFEDIKRAFQDTTGIKVKTVVGSSGRLTAQIENGAPFDVFLSADTQYPAALEAEGLTFNAPRVYAHGALVIWSLSDIDLSEGVRALTKSAIRKIAIANPKTAPYGGQAMKALQYHQLDAAVPQKLVYGESLAQVNQFVLSHAAQVGLTAKSVVMAPHMKGQGVWVDVDPAAYEPIAQAAVILNYARRGHLTEAQRLFEFLFQPQAQAIFRQYGYLLPQDARP